MHIEDEDLFEEDLADDDEPDDIEQLCWVDLCAAPTAGDTCDCCGIPMCALHYSGRGGFCPQCPTPTWIAEQERQAAYLDREKQEGSG